MPGLRIRSAGLVGTGGRSWGKVPEACDIPVSWLDRKYPWSTSQGSRLAAKDTAVCFPGEGQRAADGVLPGRLKLGLTHFNRHPAAIAQFCQSLREVDVGHLGPEDRLLKRVAPVVMAPA